MGSIRAPFTHFCLTQSIANNLLTLPANYPIPNIKGENSINLPALASY